MGGTLAAVDAMTCPRCAASGLEPGFMSDAGRGSRGFGQWIAGPLELGLLGFAKVVGRPRLAVLAYRCPQCSHLELFAPGQE